MEQSVQTLHDLVLSLLSDQSVLSAFQEDPAGVLDQAGLSDISAADVQSAIPLVMDYAPQGLEASLSQLPETLQDGASSAISQLQQLASTLSAEGLGGEAVNPHFSFKAAGGTAQAAFASAAMGSCPLSPDV